MFPTHNTRATFTISSPSTLIRCSRCFFNAIVSLSCKIFCHFNNPNKSTGRKKIRDYILIIFITQILQKTKLTSKREIAQWNFIQFIYSFNLTYFFHKFKIFSLFRSNSSAIFCVIWRVFLALIKAFSIILFEINFSFKLKCLCSRNS